MNPQKMMVICGATGVGKTDLSIALAHVCSGEIVNADVGQFYTPLSIGTAKPHWQTSDIKHHLFDIIDQPEDFSVVAYRKKLEKTLRDMLGNMPLIVGGSTLYIQALFFPPISNKYSITQQARISYTWQDLNQIDPERARNIHPNDIYRIQRALSIWHTTGEKPSYYKPIYDPIMPAYHLIILCRDRDDLYDRINYRIKSMFAQGWIEEVQKLMLTPWKLFLLKKKIIGYDDIIHYLENPLSKTQVELMRVIAQKTRAYAKRQMTFWRMLEKKLSCYIKNDSKSSIYTINLTHTNIDETTMKILSL